MGQSKFDCMDSFEVPSPPANIGELAEACVRYVHQTLGITLDYTSETLPILDHYVQLVGKPSDETLTLLSSCLGAYFGEVVRRRFGSARWHLSPEKYADYRMEFERFYLHFNPIGIAREALTQKEDTEWHGFFQLLEEDKKIVHEVLDRAGSVEEADYYLFSVRWDVLQIVVDTLTTRAASDGHEAQRFGPETYRAIVDSEKPPKGIVN